MNPAPLLQEIDRRPLCCDGAMGTQLISLGLGSGECGMLWNVNRPAEIGRIHLAYRQAGCDLITTNSFGGSRFGLARHGLADRGAELNRAAAQIARLDAAMARARQTVSEKHISVLPLSRRGWVSGRGSLISALLTETGLFNAAEALGIGAGGFASLEQIVQARPDFLLVSEAGDRAEDEGRAFLLHPALERLYPPAKRIVIPERLTVCGGVMQADALDVLVKELQRVGR